MKKCKKCNITIWSGKGEDEECIRCQIGDTNPAVWALERIHKNLLQDYSSCAQRKNLPVKTDWVSLYYNAKTGECTGGDYTPNSNEHVCIRVFGGCTNNAESSGVWVSFVRWTANGQQVYKRDKETKISSLENFVAEALPIYTELLFDLLKFAQRKTYVCSTCDVEKSNPSSGRHFGGIYCEKCWATYQKKNSSSCGMCRSPLWKCHC